MANTYTHQSWNQNQATYTQNGLQLENEFSFQAIDDSQRQTQVTQQQPGFPVDNYQSHPHQLLTNNTSPFQIHRSNFSTTQSHPVPLGVATNGQAREQSPGFIPVNFGANQPRSQNSGSFDNMYNNQAVSDQHLGWGNSSFNYRDQSPTINGYPANGYNDGGQTLGTGNLSSSPGTMQDSIIPRGPYYPQATSSRTSEPMPKRHFTQMQDEARDDEVDADMAADAKEAAKIRPGACARCKNLKVKCEFKTDTDPCKRCLNGGHDCVIPGRKKRKTPPKREHLLNEIRAQAAQIRELMTQLEATHQTPHLRRPPSITSDSYTSSTGLNSPVLSPTSTTSYLGSEATSSNADYNANKAVEDWIAKAKQSFQEFDGFIGIGGAGMPKSYLVTDDLENPESGDEDYADDSDDGTEDYGIAVEQPDGDGVVQSESLLKHKVSSSSIGTNSTGVTGVTRKKHSMGSAKSAILPGQAVPFGLFGDLSLKSLKTPKRRGSSIEVEEDDKASGIAGTNFFKSTPAPGAMDRRLADLQIQAPDILKRGIITPSEAEKLFQIYFERMNLSVSLLDPVLYTALRTYHRSPFLFTVICAISSRFYPERPELYLHAMRCAELAAGITLISGVKNVEMVQAYILMSLYPVPTKRWEDQRNWLYLGLAIRTATDLNLHLPTTAKPLSENHAREMLNRTRVWLNCFNLDRSTSSQYGKAPIISNADYMANHSENWWKSSPYNMKNFDIQICAYNSELKVMAAFIAKIYSDPHHPTGLNREVDFEKIATEADDELKQLGDKWFTLLEQTDMNDPQNSFRTGLLKLAFPYARLVALSYGFQHAFGKGHTDENPFLMRCLTAATDVVNAVLNDICRPNQLPYWRHGPEAQSVFVTFASAFLVKLLQPKFAPYLTMEKRVEIRHLVQKVVDLLSSPEIAIDDRHGPKLYSKFLKGLLAAPMAKVELTPPTRKVRRPKSASDQTPEPTTDPSIYSHPSPAGSDPLSPPPRPTALSFDSFAPVGATDPFAPELAGTSNSLNISGVDDGTGINIMSDFFQPPLPFDEEILQSMQSYTDPSGWQDTALPAGFNWSTQFQRNIGIDFGSQYPSMFNDDAQYMTGVQQ